MHNWLKILRSKPQAAQPPRHSQNLQPIVQTLTVSADSTGSKPPWRESESLPYFAGDVNHAFEGDRGSPAGWGAVADYGAARSVPEDSGLESTLTQALFDDRIAMAGLL